MIIFNKRYCWPALLIFILGCAEEREDPEMIGSPYFPLEIGNFWEYTVDETTYFGENDFEVENYFYRDEISDFYLNEAREIIYLIERKKRYDGDNWTNEVVYTASIRGNRIIRNYNNQQNIILVYPAILNKTWDANAYNTTNELPYFVESTGSYVVNTFAFPDAVKIRKSEEDDLITIRDNRYEVFARNVGMVESYDEVFRYCSRNDCLGEQIIQEGRFTHLRLVNYGKI
jgi:hypothetical protein